MALAFIVLGLMAIVSGIRGTYGTLAQLLTDDFTGAGNFWYFIAGIFFLGSIGYYAPLRDTSRLLIALVLLVFILSNGGLWQKLAEAVQNPVAATPAAQAPVPKAASLQDTSKAVTAPLSSASNPLSSNSLAVAGALGGLVGNTAGNLIGDAIEGLFLL